MVRLKLELINDFLGVPPTFTFHYGQIKTSYSDWRQNVSLKRFTFHYGQIKTNLKYFAEQIPIVFTFHYGQIKTCWDI